MGWGIIRYVYYTARGCGCEWLGGVLGELDWNANGGCSITRLFRWWRTRCLGWRRLFWLVSRWRLIRRRENGVRVGRKGLFVLCETVDKETTSRYEAIWTFLAILFTPIQL